MLSDDQIEAQIDELVTINDDSWSGLGSRFLPARRPNEGPAGIIVQLQPGSSDELLRSLVAAGAKSVPRLVAHLSDRRKTSLVVTQYGSKGGMFWSGEYDQGTRDGVTQIAAFDNRNSLGNGSKPLPPRHVFTVGDLCFAALGLIVDREFHPIRYQPTACIVINSPTTTPALAAAAVKDWSGFTPARHRQLLIDDFRRGRESSAILRLAYYFPDAAKQIALEQLKKPMYSWDVIDKFVNDSLYATGDSARWDFLSDTFVSMHGPAFKDGLMERLISDCESVERGNKPDQQDPRPIFTHLFPQLDRKKWPHEGVSIEQMMSTDLIRNLTPLISAEVDDEVFRIFHTIGSGHFDAEREDDLALACMERLIGKGHEAEFIAYCVKRQASVRYGEELGAMRGRMQKVADDQKR